MRPAPRTPRRDTYSARFAAARIPRGTNAATATFRARARYCAPSVAAASVVMNRDTRALAQLS